MIIVNFKCYEQGTGEKAVELARICEIVSQKTKVKIVVAVQASDIFRVSKEVSIDVFGQHADAVTYGAFTGHVTVGSLKNNGAVGIILNHSEKKMILDDIEDVLREAKYNGMKVVVCASDSEIGEAVGDLLPNYVAIEPPELIGGEVSVSTASSELIKEAFRRIVKKHPAEGLIVGAGIKTKDDVRKSLEYGAVGVLVSSHVVLAKDPEKVLLELCAGFK